MVSFDTKKGKQCTLQTHQCKNINLHFSKGSLCPEKASPNTWLIWDAFLRDTLWPDLYILCTLLCTLSSFHVICNPSVVHFSKGTLLPVKASPNMRYRIACLIWCTFQTAFSGDKVPLKSVHQLSYVINDFLESAHHTSQFLVIFKSRYIRVICSLI